MKYLWLLLEKKGSSIKNWCTSSFNNNELLPIKNSAINRNINILKNHKRIAHLLVLLRADYKDVFVKKYKGKSKKKILLFFSSLFFSAINFSCPERFKLSKIEEKS